MPNSLQVDILDVRVLKSTKENLNYHLINLV